MAYWYARTAPIAEPFEVDFVKVYLNVTITTDDDIIRMMISAARTWAERYLGVALVETEIEEFRDGFPSEREFDFAVGFVQNLNAMTYRDTSGAVVNFLTEYSGDYDYISSFNSNPSKFWLKNPDVSWPATYPVPNCVSMIYLAGRSQDDIDPRIKEAMLLQIQYWYRNRGDMAVGSTTFPELRSAQRILDQVPRIRI